MMRFEDQPASGDQPSPALPGRPAPGDPSARPRRRTSRSWATPAERERFDRPSADDTWTRDVPPPPPARPAPRARRTLETPPPPPPPPPAAPDLGALTGFLADLRGELGQLRSALETVSADRDASLVTGPELASTIEALGATLGNGLAALLNEHRNLLARDTEAAADRILEELSQRLRASGALIVDGVEERMRHVQAKVLGDLSQQLDLRLDQIQADVTGLRAVMLEIPDQTAVVQRLDQILEAVGPASGRSRDANRLTPAMSAAIERSVSGPIDRIEAELASVADAVREVLDERLPGELAASLGTGGDGFPSADALEALTTEMTALRRRISLRTDARGEAVELSDAQLDDLADRVVARLSGEGRRAARGAKVPVISLADDADDADAAGDEPGDEPDPDMPVPRRGRKATKRAAAPAKKAAKRKT